ncbi:MAG: hypothetical protein JXA61_07515 [Bacteroidales bacterium]|nr:hypothetical protein [Bacteroidales bacterium]
MKTFLLFWFICSMMIGGPVMPQDDTHRQTKKTDEERIKEEETNGITAQEKPHSRSETDAPGRIEEEAQPYIEEKANGSVNWTEQYIEATGETAIDTIRFKNKAQAIAMAIRGAVVVAQRNLLEIINGVKVHGETTVENLVTTSDYVYTRVDGLVRGAEMAGDPVELMGMMQVTMRIPLYEKNGLAPAVYEIVQTDSPWQGHVAGSDNGGETPLNYVFNMKGNTFDPSLFPLIIDDENNVLLDMTRIYNPETGAFPRILQTTRNMMQTLDIQEGVEVIDIIDSFGGKLKVNNQTKRKVNWEKVAQIVATIGKIVLLLA